MGGTHRNILPSTCALPRAGTEHGTKICALGIKTGTLQSEGNALSAEPNWPGQKRNILTENYTHSKGAKNKGIALILEINTVFK